MPIFYCLLFIALGGLAQSFDFFAQLSIRLKNLDSVFERQIRFLFTRRQITGSSIKGQRLVILSVSHMVFSSAQLQRKFFWVELTCQGDFFDSLWQISKAVVNLRQPRNVLRRLAFAFRNRFPNLQRLIGTFENMKVLTEVFAILRFARRQFDRLFVALDGFCFQPGLTIEICHLRVRDRIVGPRFDNTAPDLDRLFASFRLFDVAILHHQLAPVAQKVWISRCRFNQQRILL